MTIGIRPAVAQDNDLIYRFICDLADYEKLRHEVRADPVIVAGPVAWITDVRILIGSPRGELPVRHLG